MKPRVLLALALVGSTAAFIAAKSIAAPMPVGNTAVPQPTKPVDLDRYAGLWFEIGRYENRFERGCDGVTAEYRKRPDGLIDVINSCRTPSAGGKIRVARGRAKIVEGAQGAKLKVSFFGPFFGDYWVLDHGDDYDWSIVGEPSGRYLWLLSRTASPSAPARAAIEARVRSLGYDTALIRPTQP